MHRLWRTPYEKVPYDIPDDDTDTAAAKAYSPIIRQQHTWPFSSKRNIRIIYVLGLTIIIGLILSIIGLWVKASHIQSTLPATQYHYQPPNEHQNTPAEAHEHSMPDEHEDSLSDEDLDVPAPHDQDDLDEKPVRVCGDTMAEAMLLGCTFDPLTWSWLSPNCPLYARDDFMADQPEQWSYYMDAQGLVVAERGDWDKMMNNEVRVYAKRSEHITQCIYKFLSMAQVIHDGTPTHPRLSSYDHIYQCVQLVLESVKLDKDWDKIDTDMGWVSFDEGC